jgi:hypothetical protein
MSKQTADRLPIVSGQARVESRVAVWTQCPLCLREHSHILTARDHLELPGTRYWYVDCHGNRYFLGVASSSIAHAVALATDIATTYDLSQRWLAQDAEEIACPCAITHQ